MPDIHDARATYGASLAFVSSRDELPTVLNQRGLFGCGVEVGVKEGEFSELLLRGWAGAHLISVDPWLADDAAAYVDIANVTQTQHERFYERTRARLAPFGARSSIWRATSLEAVARIPRHSLDFVYVDARHDYASVMEDLEAWFDRVRPGGILAGHDYLDGMLPAGEFGVRSAVDQFFGARGLAVHPTLHDEPWLTWMVEIPRPSWGGVAHAVAPRPAASVPAPVPAHLPPDASPAASYDAGLPPDVAARSRIVTVGFEHRGEPRRFVLRLDPSQYTQSHQLQELGAGTMYEASTSSLLAEILEPGDNFVDVGAHVGFFSMLAATLVGPTGRVIAFEPVEENHRHVEEHVERNGFENVYAIRAAVGAKEGSAELFFNADNDGGHALWDVGEHGFNVRSRSAPERRVVPVTSLDAVLVDAEGPVPIKAIKIDAEGSELRVLEGARSLLAVGRVPYVILEINTFALERTGASEPAIRAFMRGLGYETHALPPGGGLVRLADDQCVVSDQVYNLVFRHAG